MKMKIILPFAVIGIGILGAAALIASRDTVQTRPPDVPPPLVRVLPVGIQDLQLKVFAQGTVVPRTESTLIAQVPGEIISVAPAFASGGFFEKGDILLKIDPRDYEVAIAQARVQVAQAELRLARENEEADLAREEWEKIGTGEATPLVLREPQIAEARAVLEAARGALARANLNLDRTRIKAPYAGRVRGKNADVGQYVNPGSPLGRIYAVDYAEVRLPIPDDQLAYLNISFDFRGQETRHRGPEVLLRATFAGKQHTWSGRIVRVEGEVDARSRMVHLVARVENPYAPGDASGRPPLAVGLFVEAEILGKTVQDISVLPRSALRDKNKVLVVQEGNRLFFREIDILRADAGQIIVRSGLATGEQVCLSPMDAVVDGMRIRTVVEAGNDLAYQEGSDSE